MPIQILLVLILMLALIVTWKRVQERAIYIYEAFFWSVIWIGAAIVVLMPNWTSRIASWVGIGRGADLIVYAAIITLFLLAFKIFISLEAIEKRLTDFVRKDALKDVEKKHGK